MTSCKCTGGRRGGHRLVVGFITTHELSAYLSPLMLRVRIPLRTLLTSGNRPLLRVLYDSIQSRQRKQRSISIGQLCHFV